MNDSRRMSAISTTTTTTNNNNNATTYVPSTTTTTTTTTSFDDANTHYRDGSLLKRKQEQWAKEKVNTDTWFPFGTPGGGAPNRKYEAKTPQTPEFKMEQRSTSLHSNGDSGHWSGSENNPPKEVGILFLSLPRPSLPESEGHARGAAESVRCPCSVASTSTAHPSVLIARPSQMIVEGGQQYLPPVGARSTSFVAPVSTPPGSCAAVPVQFIYASNANGQAIPIPVELIQSPTTIPHGIPYAYPVQVISPVALNVTPTTSTDGSHHELPTLASSYTEHWANHLSHWGTNVARIDENTKALQTGIDATTCVSLPPIGIMQSGTAQKPVLPTQITSPQLGTDDMMMRKSMSDSITSLNSSSRRSADDDSRSRARQNEQIFDEQVAERRRMEAQRIEEDKRETMIKERERRRMEELERERENEEERRKAQLEEERERIEAALLASIERAKREAELRKKARLYKHVFENTEKSIALQHHILGEDDRENSRILKEVESMERQKEYDYQKLNSVTKSSSAKKAALSERGTTELNRPSPISQNTSFDDERPIKGAHNSSYISQSFGSNTDSHFSRDKRGYQSMRVNSTPRTRVPRRSDSAERSKKPSESSSSTPANSQRRRSASQCLIPVRPQRRIPPPAPRSRRTSMNESATTTTSVDQSNTLPSDRNVEGNLLAVDQLTPSKTSHLETDPKPFKLRLRETRSLSIEQEQLEPSAFASSYSDSIAWRSKQLNVNNANMKSPQSEEESVHQMRSCDLSITIGESLKANEKTGSKYKTKTATNTGNETLLTENPLFQQVTTRCRRARAVMGNMDLGRESSSCSSGSSPPPLSTEDESLSPPPQNTTHNSSTSSDKDLTKTTTAPRPIVRSSAVKVVVSDSSSSDSVARSPFKQTLAEWGSLDRHREELLSPEIRRRGEFPNSTRLRNSMANLAVEESDDGRVSPASPLIQRFNSKTSQYRSFNLKKTSERNQKVLDQLAQLRAQLKQKQQQMERSFASSNGSLISRSRSNTCTNGTSKSAGEAVAAV